MMAFIIPKFLSLTAVILLPAASALCATSLLEEGYRQMYNLRFDDAHKAFGEHARNSPSDPLGPVSDAAAYLFSEFDRLNVLSSEFWTNDDNFLDFHKLDADLKTKALFEAALEKGKQLAEAELRAQPDAPDALFASVLRLGLHSDYLALIEKRNLAALSEVKQSRALASQLLSRHPEYYDAYIAQGIENYLLSLKPAPVRWVLHVTGSETDRHVGIEKLRVTAEKGHYLLPYARLLLALANLRAHEPEQAREKLEWLVREFPENRLYRKELAKLN
jgi:hypothetical protein